MPKECTICRHRSRREIDEAIVGGGVSLRRISSQFGMSEASLRRHKPHIPRDLAQAKEAADVAGAETLLDKVKSLEADARRIGKQAEENDDPRTALTAIDKLVRIVELMGKLNGELQNGTTVKVNVAMSALIVEGNLTEQELRDVIRAKAMSREEKLFELRSAVARLEAGGDE